LIYHAKHYLYTWYVFESNFIHFILGSLGSDINLEVGKHAGKARGKKKHEFEPWQHGTMLNLG
jgi:hypothetical protein